MSSIQDWSTTAASNASADAGITWAEGMASSSVNDSARQMMGRVAEYLADQVGGVTVGGTANAITVTANEGIVAYTDGFRVVFKATSSNTAATTVSVNSIGAKSVRQYSIAPTADIGFNGGEIVSGRIYELVYFAALNAAAGGWLITNSSRPLVCSGITGNSAMATTTGSLGEMEFRGNGTGASMIAFLRTGFAAYIGIDTDNILKVGGWSMGANAYKILHEGLTSATFAGQYTFTGATQSFGFFSLTGATAGITLGGSAGRVNISTNASTTTGLIGFYNPNGNVGFISTNASATTYNTTSDKRLKENLRDFDAGAIIDATSTYLYDWKAGGTGYGVVAQEAQEVFPDAVSIGNGNLGDEDFLPWAVDYSKYVPILLAEIKALRARVGALEAK